MRPQKTITTDDNIVSLELNWQKLHSHSRAAAFCGTELFYNEPSQHWKIAPLCGPMAPPGEFFTYSVSILGPNLSYLLT